MRTRKLGPTMKRNASIGILHSYHQIDMIGRYKQKIDKYIDIKIDIQIDKQMDKYIDIKIDIYRQIDKWINMQIYTGWSKKKFML